MFCLCSDDEGGTLRSDKRSPWMGNTIWHFGISLLSTLKPQLSSCYKNVIPALGSTSWDASMASLMVTSSDSGEDPTMRFRNVHHLFRKIDCTSGDCLIVTGYSYTVISSNSVLTIQVCPRAALLK